MSAALAIRIGSVDTALRSQARPRYLTPGVWVVAAVAAVGAVVWAWRLIFGLGATTHLSNAYPWGIWISIDVATGVALAAGGFTTAFLAHILHRERYHPLVRPALLTAMLGYTFVALGVMTDLGRFWAMWHVMLPTMWQPNSVLFEVAICVMTYLSVLYIEFLPAVYERFIGRINLPGRLHALNGAAERALRIAKATLGRFMTVFIIMGIMLSCMHQSSLGTLMVIAQDKLHPFWQTPYLPLLFLLSAFAVGYPMVIFESIIAHRSFRLPGERHLLSDLARFIPFTLGLYLLVRVIDLASRGVLSHLPPADFYTRMMALELLVGVAIPAGIFLSRRLRARNGWLLAGSAMVIAGVVINRLNVFLLGYSPLDGRAAYTPAWTEIAVTAGFIAMTVLLYRLAALNLPVIEQLHTPGARAPSHAEGVPAVCPSVAQAPPAPPGAAPQPPPRPAPERESCSIPVGAGRGAMIALLAIPMLLAAAGLTASPPTDLSQERRPGDWGPEVVVLDQVPGCYGSVRFDHRLHVGMSSIGEGCNVCHHTGKTESCRTCHDPMSSAVTEDRPGLRGAYHRQCLGCHRSWSHQNACGFCHTSSSSLATSPGRERAVTSGTLPRSTAQATYVYRTSHKGVPVVTFHHKDHAEVFGLRCVDCHVGTSCGQCHGPGAERPAVSRQQTCYRCHADSKCVTCHDLAERPPFDHAVRAHWRLRPGHQGLACSACHGPGNMPVGPSAEACKACHAAQSGGVFDHSQTGVVLYGDHALFGCVECHTGGDDRQTARCAACHDARQIVGWRAVGRQGTPLLSGEAP